MPASSYHLAQLNIAKSKDELTSAVMSGFVNRLDEINALADQSSGFIWRLQTEDGDATALRVFDDPLLIVNMSVWEDMESLQQFVYRTNHVELLRKRADWFEKLPESQQVLWWVESGNTPTIDEGKTRLKQLRLNGPEPSAFSFARPFAAPNPRD